MNNSFNRKSSGISFGTGIGSSSILVIFVILCLVSFATLSIVSANADYKLSSKVLQRSTSYYEASNQVEQSLAQLDNTLQSVYTSCESEDEYFQTVGTNKCFTIPISELQALSITVQILYPHAPEETFYKITSWQVVITGELDYNSTLNVMK